MEGVDTYRCLGVVFDSKLNWKENINSVLKKVNLRLYCMSKLRSFGVSMLVTLYNAVICSLIMLGSVCWGGNIKNFDRRRLEKTVKKAGHFVGKPLDSFKTLHEKRLYRKLIQIINDPTHPVRHSFGSRHSNGTCTNHYKALFLPSALSVFNENYTSH